MTNQPAEMCLVSIWYDQTPALSGHLRGFRPHFCQNLLGQSVWHVGQKGSSSRVSHPRSDWVQSSRFNISEGSAKASGEEGSQKQYFSVYVQLTRLGLMKGVQLLQPIKLSDLNNKMHGQPTRGGWAAATVSGCDWANRSDRRPRAARFSNTELILAKSFNLQSSVLSYQPSM